MSSAEPAPRRMRAASSWPPQECCAAVRGELAPGTVARSTLGAGLLVRDERDLVAGRGQRESARRSTGVPIASGVPLGSCGDHELGDAASVPVLRYAASSPSSSSVTSLGVAVGSSVDTDGGSALAHGLDRADGSGCADSSTQATVLPSPLNATSVTAPCSTCSAARSDVEQVTARAARGSDVGVRPAGVERGDRAAVAERCTARSSGGRGRPH